MRMANSQERKHTRALLVLVRNTDDFTGNASLAGREFIRLGGRVVAAGRVGPGGGCMSLWALGWVRALMSVKGGDRS